MEVEVEVEYIFNLAKKWEDEVTWIENVTLYSRMILKRLLDDGGQPTVGRSLRPSRPTLEAAGGWRKEGDEGADGEKKNM